MGKVFLIVVDLHSKLMEVLPLNHATTHATIEKLRQALATDGLPKKIVSDNGAPFTSAVLILLDQARRPLYPHITFLSSVKRLS